MLFQLTRTSFWSFLIVIYVIDRLHSSNVCQFRVKAILDSIPIAKYYSFQISFLFDDDNCYCLLF